MQERLWTEQKRRSGGDVLKVSVKENDGSERLSAEHLKRGMTRGNHHVQARSARLLALIF